MLTMSGEGLERPSHGDDRLRGVVLWAVAVMLFAVSFWTLPLPGLTGNGSKLILILTGITFVLGARAVAILTRRTKRIRLPWIFVGVLPLVAASLISLIGAGNLCFGLSSVLLICLFSAFGVVIANLADTEAARNRLLGALLAGAVVASLVAILEFAGPLGDAGLDSIDRVSATFGNRNFLGSLVGMLAFPAGALFLSLSRRSLRIATWLGILLCFLIPFLVQQTGVAIALLVGLLFLALGAIVFRFGRALREHWTSVAAIGLAAVVGVGIGLGVWWSRPSEPVVDTDGSLVEDLWTANYGSLRSIDWMSGWEMLRASPVTGVGLGNYKVEFLEAKTRLLNGPDGDAYDLPIFRAEQAHNDYLQLASELGVLGLLALLACFALAIWTFWVRLRRAPSSRGGLELLFVVAGAVVACAHAAVSFPFHLPASALAFVFLVGIASSESFGTSGAFELRLPRGRASAAGIAGLLVVVLIAAGLGRELVARLDLSLGVVQMEAGDLDGARRLLSRSVAESSCAIESLFSLATVEMTVADQTEDPADYGVLLASAREHAERGLRAYPSEEGMLLLIGIATRLGDVDLVETTATALLASNPKTVFEWDARALLALARARRGEIDRAKDDLRGLISEAPEYVHAYILLGSLLRQEGDVEGESDVYEEAVWGIQLAIEGIDRELADASGTRRVRLVEEREGLVEALELVLARLGG